MALKSSKFLERWNYHWSGQVSTEGIQNGGDFGASIGYKHAYFAGTCQRGITNSNYPTWELTGPRSAPKLMMGIVTAIDVDPNDHDVIYAGSNTSGLWKTEDGGNNWINLTDYLGLPSLGINSIEIDPNNSNTLYVSTLNRSFGIQDFGFGILKSTNGGVTWVHLSNLNSTPSPDYNIQDIKIDPNNSSILYAVGGAKFYKSNDAGATWQSQVIVTTSDITFYDIDIYSNNGITKELYLSSFSNAAESVDPEVFVSADQGLNWTNITPTVPTSNLGPRMSIALSEDDPGSTYLLSVDRSDHSDRRYLIYKSTNQGQNWTQIHNTLKETDYYYDHTKGQFEISDEDSDRMYVGAVVLLVSTDGGASKAYGPSRGIKTNFHDDVRDIRMFSDGNGNDILFVGTDGGVTKSSNNGVNWANLNGSNLAITQYYGFDIPRDGSNETTIGGTQDNGTLKVDNQISEHVLGGDGGWTIVDDFNPSLSYVFTNQTIYQLQNYYRTVQFGCEDVINMPRAERPFGWWLKQKIYQHPESGRIYYPRKYLNVLKDDYVLNDCNPDNWNLVWDNGNESNSPAKTQGLIQAWTSPKSDENLQFVAVDQPYWDATLNYGKFLKTTDYWQSAIDLTDNVRINNYPILRYLSISDILVSPYNNNVVYLALEQFQDDDNNPNIFGCSGKYRVIKSQDGGQTWSDISSGLPPFPVNKILFQEGTDEVLFAGTNLGVYRYSGSGGQWESFNNGLPPVKVTNLEYDRCLDKLYISTFGRGLYEADLSQLQITSGPEASELNLYGNITWDKPKIINGSVNIYGTLEIDADTKFKKEGKLIVHEGALLIVDGATLSNYCFNELWQGIELRGEANAVNGTPTRGRVELYNATIEFAEIAIVNQEDGHDGFKASHSNTTGGEIFAHSTNFVNNEIDLRLFPYASFSTINPFYRIPHNTTMVKCTFETNDNDISSSIRRVWAEQIDGLKFLGCTFKNTKSGSNANTGAAVYLTFAAAIFAPYQTSITSFDGFDAGIVGYSYSEINRFKIDKVSFSNNNVGVALDNVNNAIIIKNLFDQDKNLGNSLWLTGGNSAGLIISNSSNYIIEENDFTSGGQPSNNAESFGLVISNSGPYINQVYNNSFDGHSSAIQAIGNNKQIANIKGLVLRCNDFGNSTSNFYDVYTYAGYPAQSDDGIAGHQGHNDPNASGAAQLANNYFSRNLSDYYNENTFIPNYYYPDPTLNSNLRLEPLNPINLNLNPVQKSFNPVTDCAANYGLTGQSPGMVYGNYQLLQQELLTEYTILEQLVDEGSTSSLEAQILLSHEPQYQELYVELMEIAPYVSVENLINVLELDSFPELPMRNIMIANPEGARDPEVEYALYNHEPPYSSQTLLDIENGSMTLTTLDFLKARILDVERTKSEVLNALLILYADTSELASSDSIISLLKNSDELTRRYDLINIYLTLNNDVAAQQSLDNISLELELNDYLLDVHNAAVPIHQLLINQIASGNSIKEVDSASLNQLYNISANDSSLAGTMGYSILAMNNAAPSHQYPVYWPSPEPKSSIGQVDNRPKLTRSTFKTYPNPVVEKLIVQWDWFKEGIQKEMEITIYDLNGKTVFRTTQSDYMANTSVVDLSSLNLGAYLITIRSEGKTLYENKLMIGEN